MVPISEAQQAPVEWPLQPCATPVPVHSRSRGRANDEMLDAIEEELDGELKSDTCDEHNTLAIFKSDDSAQSLADWLESLGAAELEAPLGSLGAHTVADLRHVGRQQMIFLADTLPRVNKQKFLAAATSIEQEELMIEVTMHATIQAEQYKIQATQHRIQATQHNLGGT